MFPVLLLFWSKLASSKSLIWFGDVSNGIFGWTMETYNIKVMNISTWICEAEITVIFPRKIIPVSMVCKHPMLTSKLGCPIKVHVKLIYL